MRKQICPVCNSEFKVYGKQKRMYCSRKCLGIGYSERLKGKNNPNYKHGPPICPFCNNEMSRNAKGHYCRDCQSLAISGNGNGFFGKKHSKKTKKNMQDVWYKTHDNSCLIGIKHSDETKKKISQARLKLLEDPEFFKQRVKILYGLLQKQLQFKKNKPETIVENIIKKFTEVKYNKPLYGKFIVDFFLPKTNNIIEVFGDYWHGNKLVFDKFNEHQIKQQKKDKARLAYLRKCGHRVLVIWEYDIKNNINEVELNIKNFIGHQ